MRGAFFFLCYFLLGSFCKVIKRKGSRFLGFLSILEFTLAHLGMLRTLTCELLGALSCDWVLGLDFSWVICVSFGDRVSGIGYINLRTWNMLARDTYMRHRSLFLCLLKTCSVIQLSNVRTFQFYNVVLIESACVAQP
jgi:hypothetical protein